MEDTNDTVLLHQCQISRNGKTKETKKQISSCLELEIGSKDWLQMSNKELFWKIKVLQWDCKSLLHNCISLLKLK